MASALLAAVVALPTTAAVSTPDDTSADRLRIDVVDKEGDVRTSEGEVVDAPAFMDLTSLSLAVDGSDLLVSIQVAGDLSGVLSTSLVPEYHLWVGVPWSDTSGWFTVIPSDGWALAAMPAFWQREPIGCAQASDSRSDVRLPRPRSAATAVDRTTQAPGRRLHARVRPVAEPA